MEGGREVVAYVDAVGRSEVRDTLQRLGREDPRGAKTIQSRLRILQHVTLQQAQESGLIKRAGPELCILRVQSGAVAWRLPFFESPCHDTSLVVLACIARRQDLKGERYKELVLAAARRREDWVRRNCPKEQNHARRRHLSADRG